MTGVEPISLEASPAEVSETMRISVDDKTPQEFQPDAIPMVTENPFSQFKQAWLLAKGDQRMQQAMVDWLNDQLRSSEDMGS